MAILVPLSDVRERALQRADMEYEAGVTDESRLVTYTETDRLINVAYKELYALLVQSGLHRAETVQSITADGSTSYALNADRFAILGVYRVDDGGNRHYLKRHDHRTRPNTSINGYAGSYRVVGGSIEFNPIPNSQTYEVLYVPVPSDLADDTDTLDGVMGWEEYVVLRVAIWLMEKERVDTSSLRQDLALMVERIRNEANMTEMSEGTVVQDVRNSDFLKLPGGESDYRPAHFWPWF